MMSIPWMGMVSGKVLGKVNFLWDGVRGHGEAIDIGRPAKGKMDDY